MGSGRFAVPSPSVIEELWTWEDVLDAHEVLDIEHDLKVLQANE